MRFEPVYYYLYEEDFEDKEYSKDWENWVEEYDEYPSIEIFLEHHSIDYQFENDSYMYVSKDKNTIQKFLIEVIEYPNKYKVTEVSI